MAVSVLGFKSIASRLWPLSGRLVAEILVGVVSYGTLLLLLHRNYLQGILQFVRTTSLGSMFTSPKRTEPNLYSSNG